MGLGRGGSSVCVCISRRLSVSAGGGGEQRASLVGQEIGLRVRIPGRRLVQGSACARGCALHTHHLPGGCREPCALCSPHPCRTEGVCESPGGGEGRVGRVRDLPACSGRERPCPPASPPPRTAADTGGRRQLACSRGLLRGEGSAGSAFLAPPPCFPPAPPAPPAGPSSSPRRSLGGFASPGGRREMPSPWFFQPQPSPCRGGR